MGETPIPHGGESHPEPVEAEALEIIEGPQKELIERLTGGGKEKYVRFVLNAVSSLPWMGVLSAAASLKSEADQERVNALFMLWMKEHEGKFKELGITLQDILGRLDDFGEVAEKRIQDPSYLALVRQAFRTWDESETNEKRLMIKKLITNAGALSLADDDRVRLFIGWVDHYHEAHFKVMAEVANKRGITRAEIWDNLNPAKRYPHRPRENSADADFFRYLIDDLTTGRVMRQEREVNFRGEFLKNTSKDRRKAPVANNDVMKSSFDDVDGYELSELGSLFVQYVMEDVVPELSAPTASAETAV